MDALASASGRPARVLDQSVCDVSVTQCPSTPRQARAGPSISHYKVNRLIPVSDTTFAPPAAALIFKGKLWDSGRSSISGLHSRLNNQCLSKRLCLCGTVFSGRMCELNIDEDCKLPTSHWMFVHEAGWLDLNQNTTMGRKEECRFELWRPARTGNILVWLIRTHNTR